nr:perilipin-3-like isoform X1 [Zootoca vivipara]
MASRSGKEIVTQTETKAWPARVDPAPSDMTRFKPKAAVFTQRGKDKTFHNAMEDIASEIQDASTSSMANSISSFVESPVGKVFATTIDRALEKSEQWLNYYLPPPDTSPADASVKKEERDTSKDDLCKEGCFMRISLLSTQLRNRAFRFVLHRLKSTRKNTNEQLSRLDQVLDMLDQSLSPGPSSFQKVSESLSNILPQWTTKLEAASQKQPPGGMQRSLSLLPEQLEMKALTMTRVLADELYTTYRNLLPHVAELPSHLQEKVTRVYESMEELHSHLSSVASLRELPTYLILQSRERINTARENLDELLDYMAQSQPGQWLSQPSTSRIGVALPSAGATPPTTGNVERKGEEGGSTSRQRSPPRPSSS